MTKKRWGGGGGVVGSLHRSFGRQKRHFWNPPPIFELSLVSYIARVVLVLYASPSCNLPLELRRLCYCWSYVYENRPREVFSLSVFLFIAFFVSFNSLYLSLPLFFSSSVSSMSIRTFRKNGPWNASLRTVIYLGGRADLTDVTLLLLSHLCVIAARDDWARVLQTRDEGSWLMVFEGASVNLLESALVPGIW